MVNDDFGLLSEKKTIKMNIKNKIATSVIVLAFFATVIALLVLRFATPMLTPPDIDFDSYHFPPLHLQLVDRQEDCRLIGGTADLFPYYYNAMLMVLDYARVNRKMRCRRKDMVGNICGPTNNFTLKETVNKSRATCMPTLNDTDKPKAEPRYAFAAMLGKMIRHSPEICSTWAAMLGQFARIRDNGISKRQMKAYCRASNNHLACYPNERKLYLRLSRSLYAPDLHLHPEQLYGLLKNEAPEAIQKKSFHYCVGS